MKFIVSSATLLKHLGALDGAIASNPVVPILENFLFNLVGDNLSVTASDLHVTITTQLEVETVEEGSVAIPAKMLSDTLRNLPEQPVTFAVDLESYTIEILSDNGRYRLTGENAADFPRVPKVENTTSVELTSELISTAISYCLFATSTDEMKPAMNGIFVNITDKAAIFVATDGHRLVRYRRFDAAEKASENTIIIPRKALSLLKRSLPSADSPLTLSFNKSHAFFRFDHIDLTCRLIDERFPDYENVIPLSNESILEIDRAELLSSLRRISIYANKSTNQIRLKLANGELLHVSAEDIDFANEASEKLACEYTGIDLEIGFNAKYMIEALGSLHSRTISMKFSEPNRASLLLPEEKDSSEDVLMLVMPVMLHNYY